MQDLFVMGVCSWSEIMNMSNNELVYAHGVASKNITAMARWRGYNADIRDSSRN